MTAWLRFRSRINGVARDVSIDAHTLYLACRDPRTPWYARLVLGAAVAYMFSPIQLIPDFVPVLGYLDNAAVLTLGAVLAARLIPSDVLHELRRRARTSTARPSARAVALAAATAGLVHLALVSTLILRITAT